MNQDKNLTLQWSELPELQDENFQPTHPGLAGALTGVSNHQLVIAGGSNFLDALPWNGGTKKYYNTIYAYNLKSEEGVWQECKTELPINLAYAASTSINNKIISVGGENEKGAVVNVYSMALTSDKIEINRLPDYPIAVSNAGITTINEKVFVVGGMNEGKAIASFYYLDLKNISQGWIKLPDITKAFTNVVVAAQNDGNDMAIYVLGGRNKTSELTDFSSDVWKFSLETEEWEMVSSIQSGDNLTTLAAGTGVAFGDKYILLFGGDDGEKYNKTETYINAYNSEKDVKKKEQINSDKIAHLTNHPGFSRDVLLYNTHTNSWKKIDEFPQATPVTTNLVKDENDVIYIPNGEVRPGVRSNKIIKVKIN